LSPDNFHHPILRQKSHVNTTIVVFVFLLF
jgi:hypothetical protein